jgi:hypothetical protein
MHLLKSGGRHGECRDVQPCEHLFHIAPTSGAVWHGDGGIDDHKRGVSAHGLDDLRIGTAHPHSGKRAIRGDFGHCRPAGRVITSHLGLEVDSDGTHTARVPMKRVVARGFRGLR